MHLLTSWNGDGGVDVRCKLSAAGPEPDRLPEHFTIDMVVDRRVGSRGQPLTLLLTSVGTRSIILILLRNFHTLVRRTKLRGLSGQMYRSTCTRDEKFFVIIRK